MIRQGLIHIEEIGPPALESPDHIGSRDIVAPCLTRLAILLVKVTFRSQLSR
jgi:hypothetical protein